MPDIFDEIRKAAEQGAESQLLQQLESEGIDIECTSCQYIFTAHSINAVCPNCSEITEIIID